MNDNYNFSNYPTFSSEMIKSLLKEENYLIQFYTIKEKIEYSQNMEKIFAISNDQNLNVIISRQSFEFENKNFNERISLILRFLENNLVLVENFWIEEDKSSYIPNDIKSK